MIDELKLWQFAKSMEQRIASERTPEVHCEDLMRDFGFEYPFWNELNSWAARARLPFLFNPKDYYSADLHARMIIFSAR